MFWFQSVGARSGAASEDPDHALVRAIAGGDPSALEQLYRRHSRQLHWYIFARLGDRQLAEETLQDVMLAAWRGAKRFRGDASVRTWLYGIAHRRAASAARNLPKDLAPDGSAELVASSAPEPPEWAADRRRAAEVRHALARLPEHQRLVIELVYLHGLTGPEAARVLGVPLGTIKSRQNRALKALAPLLAEHQP